MPLPPFELLYRRHRDELYGYLRGQLEQEEAADAFQETFLRALRSYDGLQHRRALRAWLYTIARSVLADRARRAARRPVNVGLTEQDMGPETASADPVRRIVEDSGLVELTSGLPPVERTAVVLRYRFDMEYAEIGKQLESSPDAARQAASSGVRRLREQLAGDSDGQNRSYGQRGA